jgi:hypothetical protein
MYKTYVKDMSSPNDLFGLSSRIAYFKNLKDQLEAHQTKTKSVLFRRKLLENQKKQNYSNELHRIRGYLSQTDTRLPIGTVERLKEREKALKKLGGYIADEIN